MEDIVRGSRLRSRVCAVTHDDTQTSTNEDMLFEVSLDRLQHDLVLPEIGDTGKGHGYLVGPIYLLYLDLQSFYLCL